MAPHAGPSRRLERELARDLGERDWIRARRRGFLHRLPEPIPVVFERARPADRPPEHGALVVGRLEAKGAFQELDGGLDLVATEGDLGASPKPDPCPLAGPL